VLASLVLLAVVGHDLGPQQAAQPVNPGLDLFSRVAILMREHRTQVGQQVEHDPHGPGEGHSLSGEAVMEELGERLEDRLALIEMTKHEFLDERGKFRRERTTFADGTTVTVDWDKESVDITPDLD